ncbi:hypothetical protein Q6271_26420, partial [Klebsiella pneumoniae]|nr:hypothetical protein [Klebsiella pneumoniae]
MQLTLQIVITDESGSSRTEELMTIQKSGETRNDIGLSVSESKLLLNTVQQSVVQLQADEYTQHGTVAKLAMRQPFVLFKGLTFQKLCL